MQRRRAEPSSCTSPHEVTVAEGEQPAALDNSVTVTFEFTVDEVGATTTCRVDGGSILPCTSPHVVDNLTEGTHELIVTATDPAGNVEQEPARHAWMIDTSAPDTLIDRAPSGAVS